MKEGGGFSGYFLFFYYTRGKCQVTVSIGALERPPITTKTPPPSTRWVMAPPPAGVGPLPAGGVTEGVCDQLVVSPGMLGRNGRAQLALMGCVSFAILMVRAPVIEWRIVIMPTALIISMDIFLNMPVS